MATARDLLRYVDTQTIIGQTIQVTVWRDGQEVTVPVTLSEKPRSVDVQVKAFSRQDAKPQRAILRAWRRCDLA